MSGAENRRAPDARLLAVAARIPAGAVVADIGADHALLTCHLVEERGAARAFACDIAPGPLAAARARVRARGLEGRIECRLTDGLAGLPLDTITHIVIAGMGGESIAAILAACPAARDSRLTFVLQPMTKAERLRAALRRLGFCLTDERGVAAGGRLYTVMTAVFPGGEAHSGTDDTPLFDKNDLFDARCWTGLLPQSPSAESRALLRKTARRLRRAGEGLRRSAEGREKGERLLAVAQEIEGQLTINDVNHELKES